MSVFSGMSDSDLLIALAEAQKAYLALSTGDKGESFSYTQGDGAKSVTYNRTNLPQLFSLIKALQKQLGLVAHSRRPARFVMR